MKIQYELPGGEKGKDAVKVVRLKLVPEETDGSVDLCTVYEDGDVDEFLLSFTTDGRIRRYDGCEDGPFETDDDGRVVIGDAE